MTQVSNSTRSKNTDFLCPVCFEIISEAHITKCGHTYCHKCIIKSIDVQKKCPKCNSNLSSTDQIFPNFLLNELIKKHQNSEDEKKKLFPSSAQSIEEDDPSDTLKTFLATESKKLSLPDVTIMLEVLTQRKTLLEAESITAQNKLLYEFLHHLLLQTEHQQKELENKTRLIKSDIKTVENILKTVKTNCPKLEDVDKHFAQQDQLPGKSTGGESSTSNVKMNAMRDELKQLINDIDSSMPGGGEEAKNSTESSLPSSTWSSYKIRKQRMFAHFDDFVTCYYNNRSEDLHFQQNNEELMITDTNESVPLTRPCGESLDLFRDNLTKFSRFNQLRTLSTLNYSNDTNLMSSTIVSSIEFDKDSEYFAIAGVTKRIKIFDYYTCIRDGIVDIKYPINEMVCNSKISCVVWNCYFKELLASSDYEGIVSIWDVETRQRKRTFQEHDKRCWSVDFNEIDTKLLASGSDDARVKLWSIDCENAVATLEVKANVCCVKFNPKSSCHLAFGSADHGIHYYDLRNLKEPLCVFKGHKKAVSYVKFLNTHEIISAGTDGQLKLWNVNQPPYCLRSFVGGHINEKNFVGLATNGDYLACGSEDNSLCVYYKGLSKQLFNLKFDLQTARYNSGVEVESKTASASDNDFVSAVCWRKQSNTIIAGNSRGIIKILELV
ncbi:unnamed protein product [Diamesa hyperborea]